MEPLDAGRIRGRLPESTARWLASLEVFESIGSTNTYLMGKAASGSIDGHVCLAEHQSAGRGRRGRSWKSPRGRSIAMSVGQQVAVPPMRLGALSLVTGVAVAVALERCGVPGVGLKWPNDVFLEGAKLGGILIEVVPLVQPSLTVIGIGINVERDEAELGSVPDPVAALSDVRAGVSRNDLCAALIESVHAHAIRFESEGFLPFRAAWSRRNVHANRAVTVAFGTETVLGTVVGIGDGGELVLETASGERRIASGEVTLRAVPTGQGELPGSG